MMIRKYLPYMLLVLAASLYVWVTTHQRGYRNPSAVSQTETTPAAARPSGSNNENDFNRSATRIIYSKHAHCRMDCRHINEEEVQEILKNGKVNQRKIETDSRGTTYPLEGVAQGHHLRIVFAPKGGDAVEVVTCIDLDRDWPCHCN